MRYAYLSEFSLFKKYLKEWTCLYMLCLYNKHNQTWFNKKYNIYLFMKNSYFSLSQKIKKKEDFYLQCFPATSKIFS